MRLFISVNLSDEIQDAITDVQDAMMDAGIWGNYTMPENMHITLAFIGDFDDPDRVLDVLDSISFTPFEIKLKGIGSFRDLWYVGLEDSLPLQSVVRKIRRALANARIPFDRKRFMPHITIVRQAEGEAEGVAEAELEKLESLSMTVDYISLMKSERGKHGMIYTEL